MDMDIDRSTVSGIESTAILCAYQQHQAQTYSLSWSPDSCLIVSGAADGTARVWDATTGETVTLFDGHTASVNAVAWSPQGTLIASAGSDRTVWVWDALTGERVCCYRGHSGWIFRGLAWSPDGNRVASASWDHTVQVWDAHSAETLLTCRGHESIVYSLAWSPDGTRLVSGGGYPEAKVQLWDARTGALLLTYQEHMVDVNKEREIDESWGEVMQDYARGASSVHGLSWSPDGRWIASAGLRSVCRVWDASTGNTHIRTGRSCGPLAWSPDSTLLLSVNHSKHIVEIWQALTERLLVTYDHNELSEIEAVGWSPDGTRIAFGGKTCIIVCAVVF